MMEAHKDTQRVAVAVNAICDGRNVQTECSSIMVTAEHVVASVLLVLFKDPDTAVAMLNEGLLQSVESRLSLYKSRKPAPRPPHKGKE